jgi:hypothetical protein
MHALGSKFQWVASIGALAVLLTVLAAWIWTFHSPSVAGTSLSPADVQQIMKIVSTKRWEMARFALRKREFTLLRYFLLARFESIKADSAASSKAAVLCRPAFDAGVSVIMSVQRQGTNGWSFETWMVTENTRQPAPLQPRPGTPVGKTNAARSVRPVANPITSLDAAIAPMFHIAGRSRGASEFRR